MTRAVSRGALVLADGTTFFGTAVGATGVATGEVVFNTSMTGYQEIATDPSYAGQIVTLTSPHIGNYGVADADDQAPRPYCSGLVVRAITNRPSSWRARGTFPDWLRRNGIVALTDIDTRRLTRHIRAHGAMPGAIGSAGAPDELAQLALAAPRMEGVDLASQVTTDQAYVAEAPAARGRVVAIDLGIKSRIITELTNRGLTTHVVPANTSADEILALEPDGVFLSNGPGDPEPLTDVVATVQALIGHRPVFGICLGHQVLGLALGASTFKLPFGHHGGNHPVRRNSDGKVEITAQNHGFAVDAGSDNPDSFSSEFGPVDITHINLNDNTVEGIACRDVAASSVQYHPEAAPGPNDALHLFDRFAATIGRTD